MTNWAFSKSLCLSNQNRKKRFVAKSSRVFNSLQSRRRRKKLLLRSWISSPEFQRPLIRPLIAQFLLLLLIQLRLLILSAEEVKYEQLQRGISRLAPIFPEDSPFRESETISSLPLPDDTEATTILDSLVTKQLFSRKNATLNLEENQKVNKADGEENSTKHKNDQGGDDSVWLVSSDSEPPSTDPIKLQVIISTEEDEDLVILDKEVEPAVKKAPKKKASSSRQIPKEESSAQETNEDTDSIVAEEVATDKNTKPSSGSSSKLPLVLSEKVNRSKVLVECEGDSIDLSGDMGAVGRVVVSDTTQDVFFDLKENQFMTGVSLLTLVISQEPYIKSTIVPSRTFCVVNVSQSEAKIEAIMNDFIQLTPVSNVYEAETMVEGTLEGFSFDSDDEGNKNAKTGSKPPDDQSGDTAEITTKGSGKAKAKCENVVGKKRGRPSKEKQQQQPAAKKARSSSAPKKTKPKK